MIDIDGLNSEKAIAAIGGQSETYINVLSMFHKSGIEKISEIKTCIETGDIKLYTIYVHAIKSAAEIIGAEKLSETAAALEKAGKQEDLSFIQTNNQSFLDDLEKVLNNIKMFLSKEAENNIITDSESLKNELLKLKDALNNFDSIAMNETAEYIQRFSQNAKIGGSINTILENKLIGEYENAVQLIDALLTEL